MKKLLFLVLGIASITFYSCSKSSSTVTESTGLTVTLSRDTVEANGWDIVQVTVKDGNGNNITSSCNLTFNGASIDSIFTATTVGTFKVTATKAVGSGTASATLIVVAESPSAFTKNLLIEDFSGTWCGYCPRMAYELDQYTLTQPKACWITAHGYQGSGDPYVFQYEGNMETYYNVQGFPTGIVDGYVAWDENNSTLDNEYTKWTPLGLAVSSTTSGSTISGTAQVKFNVTTNHSLKIVVALVESGIISNAQHNYYIPGEATYSNTMPYLYGGVSPIVNFEEKNVLRNTSTNYLGDSIPVSAETKGNIYSLPFSFPTSGTTADGISFTVVPANCKIVAYVLDGNGTFQTTTLGVINVQQAAVGKTQTFN